MAKEVVLTTDEVVSMLGLVTFLNPDDPRFSEESRAVVHKAKAIATQVGLKEFNLTIVSSAQPIG